MLFAIHSKTSSSAVCKISIALSISSFFSPGGLLSAGGGLFPSPGGGSVVVS